VVNRLHPQTELLTSPLFCADGLAMDIKKIALKKLSGKKFLAKTAFLPNLKGYSGIG